MTLIELLIVISVIAIIGTFTTPFLSNFIVSNNFETTMNEIIGTIRKAQNYSMSGKNEGAWGVCLKSSKITLFKGSCNLPVFTESYDVPASVTVVGLNEITFSNKLGEPSSSLAITVSAVNKLRTINLNQVGGITIN